MGGPVAEALLQGPHRALAAVLGGELPLGLRDLLDRLPEVAAGRLAALEDAGLVEVDVGLDEARPDEAPPMSRISASAERPGSMAAIRPPSIPMSTAWPSWRPATRAFLRMRSMASPGLTPAAAGAAGEWERLPETAGEGGLGRRILAEHP